MAFRKATLADRAISRYDTAARLSRAVGKRSMQHWGCKAIVGLAQAHRQTTPDPG
jgi:hypothetical protein